MKALKAVRETRMKLKTQGVSENSNRDAIEDLFAEAQRLIGEMHAAKLVAMREAEKPYLDRLRAIDEEMAMFITLAA